MVLPVVFTAVTGDVRFEEVPMRRGDDCVLKGSKRGLRMMKGILLQKSIIYTPTILRLRGTEHPHATVAHTAKRSEKKESRRESTISCWLLLLNIEA